MGKSEMNSVLKTTVKLEAQILFPWGLCDKLQNGVNSRAI